MLHKLQNLIIISRVCASLSSDDTNGFSTESPSALVTTHLTYKYGLYINYFLVIIYWLNNLALKIHLKHTSKS